MFQGVTGVQGSYGCLRMSGLPAPGEWEAIMLYWGKTGGRTFHKQCVRKHNFLQFPPSVLDSISGFGTVRVDLWTGRGVLVGCFPVVLAGDLRCKILSGSLLWSP
jgi:hypothetical protein